MTGLIPRRTLPVLMYHRIGSLPQGDPLLWISEPVFLRQLEWLASRGFRTLSLDEAYSALSLRSTPTRSILITFDDAFDETLVAAAELLIRTGHRAATFAPAGLLGSRVDLAHPNHAADHISSGTISDAAGLRKWRDRGLDVGSHSMSHLDLRGAETAVLEREIVGSRQRLEDILGQSICDFCYPFAYHDAAARDFVQATGYRVAYAGEPPVDELFAVPRMMIYPIDSEARFARKVSGYYYWLSAWHHRLRRLSGRSQPIC